MKWTVQVLVHFHVSVRAGLEKYFKINIGLTLLGVEHLQIVVYGDVD